MAAIWAVVRVAGQDVVRAMATICCRQKYTSVSGLRPIAVGGMVRRLTSKCVVRAVQSEAFRMLPPLQMGVGVPAGCEAIVHAVANVLDDSSIPHENRFILLVDFSNAFNMVEHGAMFQEVRARIPSMATWLESCYSSQIILHLDDQVILSCCGVQQGDLVGPLGFALAIHPIVEKINEEVGAFDDLMQEALSDLAESPLPDWAWLKASLPSSLGGLNIRKASLHAPAAYISSFHQVQPLILGILDRSPMAPPHLPSAICALAQAAANLSGALFRIPTFDSSNIAYLMLLMKPSTQLFWLMLQIVVPERWPSPRQFPMLGIG